MQRREEKRREEYTGFQIIRLTTKLLSSRLAFIFDLFIDLVQHI